MNRNRDPETAAWLLVLGGAAIALIVLVAVVRGG